MRTLPLLLIVGLLAAIAAAPAEAGRDGLPRQLQSHTCQTIKVHGKTHVLYRYGVSCAFAKRWVRRLNASHGRSRPRGFSCSSGAKFRGAAYCATATRHFGWHQGD